ncbi:hypothetical protein CHUAL_004203 [Chamberlinius hualienensis]
MFLEVLFDFVYWIILLSTLLVICIVAFNILNNRWRKELINYKDKRVFITGCDTGFGNILATKFDKMGMYVYAGCYSQQGATELQNATSSKLKTVIIDITNDESVNEAKNFVEADLPEGTNLWGLVNNAGIIGCTFFPYCNLNDFRDPMDVNFFGTIRVIEAFLPLIKRSKGRIINVCSVAGRVALCFDSYSCSKHALVVYTDGLRRSMKRYGVDAISIEPMMSPHTNIFNEQSIRQMDEKWKAMSEEDKKTMGNRLLKVCKLYYYATQIAKDYIPTWVTTDSIIESVSHGLTSKRPKSRYVTGFLGRTVVILGSIAPDWLVDTILLLPVYSAY